MEPVLIEYRNKEWLVLKTLQWGWEDQAVETDYGIRTKPERKKTPRK